MLPACRDDDDTLVLNDWKTEPAGAASRTLNRPNACVSCTDTLPARVIGIVHFGAVAHASAMRGAVSACRQEAGDGREAGAEVSGGDRGERGGRRGGRGLGTVMVVILLLQGGGGGEGGEGDGGDEAGGRGWMQRAKALFST